MFNINKKLYILVSYKNSKNKYIKKFNRLCDEVIRNFWPQFVKYQMCANLSETNQKSLWFA